MWIFPHCHLVLFVNLGHSLPLRPHASSMTITRKRKRLRGYVVRTLGLGHAFAFSEITVADRRYAQLNAREKTSSTWALGHLPPRFIHYSLICGTVITVIVGSLPSLGEPGFSDRRGMPKEGSWAMVIHQVSRPLCTQARGKL